MRKRSPALPGFACLAWREQVEVIGQPGPSFGALFVTGASRVSACTVFAGAAQ